MSPLRISVWLLPEAEAARRIQPIIDRLAADYDGPVFDAHVTAFAGSFDGVGALQEAVEAIAAGTAPLEFAFTRLDLGDRFTKCLFARFADDPRLLEIGDRLRPLCLAPARFELDPHLSLYYGERGDVDDALGTIAFPLARVRFDRLAINLSPERTTRREVVEAWERIGEFSFRG